MLITLLFACAAGSGDTATPTAFDFTVANTSTAGALVPSEGSTFDIMLAPGVVVIHQPGFSL